MEPTVLVIGCGSIGERHLRTFQRTGRCRVIACDTRADLLREVATRYGVPAAADWREALSDPAVTAVVVATPAHVHVPIALEVVRRGRHCLIEKPLALVPDGIDELLAARDAAGVFTAVAYVYRCIPAVAAARAFLARSHFGPVLFATAEAGQHFPSFRPAYRETYYTDRARGGGAIQDALTHLVDAVQWTVGRTTELACVAGHQALSGVEVEDTVAVAARAGRAIVSYTLNQFQAPNEVTLSFHAGRGSVRVENHRQRWGRLAHGEADWTWEPAPVAERDSLFLAQAAAFLDGCAGQPTALASLEDGLAAVHFARAALHSAATATFVNLPRA